MKKKPGFIINEIHRKFWDGLPPEKRGELLTILMDYTFDGILPVENGEFEMALNFLIPVIDKQKIDYEEKCKKAKEAINKRWNNEGEETE
jgi:hypothetical protein